MPTHHVYSCAAFPDVEFDKERAAPLRYDVALPGGESQEQGARALKGPSPREGKLPGVVVLIPGFGQDNDAGYLRAFRGWVAERFGLACVSVQYHGCHNRPALGASPEFNQDDATRLVQACADHGIAWPTPPQTPDLNAILAALHQANTQRAAHATARGEAPARLTLTCGLMSPDGPVNLGLPQAMDHLTALGDLQKRHAYDTANVIALGSSHGGYLAQLINRLAPHTLRAVLDNSGYAALPRRYVDSRSAGVGPDYFEDHSGTFRMAYYVTSAWRFSAEAANFYHDDARLLRDLGHGPHLEKCFADVERPAAVRCVHAPADKIAPTAEKAALVEALNKQGIDATLTIAGPGDVDGRYIKSLDHGLGLSLRMFFEREYAALPPIDGARRGDAQRGTRLDFVGPGRVYRVAHSPEGVAISLEDRAS